MTDDEKKAFDKEYKDIENRWQQDDRRPVSALLVDALGEVLDKKELEEHWSATRTTRSSPSRPRLFKLDSLDIRSPEQLKQAKAIFDKHQEQLEFLCRREGTQAQLAEARRRAAQRRAADGQGLRRHQAADLRRRQDGRPARQQGGHLQDPARRGHAVPGRRHAGGHPAQSAGRAEPYERGPDSGDAPGLGGGRSSASRPSRRSSTEPREEEIRKLPQGSRHLRERQERICTTAAPANASSSR